MREGGEEGGSESSVTVMDSVSTTPSDSVPDPVGVCSFP